MPNHGSVFNERSIQRMDSKMIWSDIIRQANNLCVINPRLQAYLKHKILAYENLSDALVGHLADILQTDLSREILFNWFSEIIAIHPEIAEQADADISRLVNMNPACPDHLTAFLSFRGVLALQAYRFAHAIWVDGDIQSAVLLQNWISKAWDIDIHPAARLGQGLFIDHGINIVIGETAVVEDNVSIWHGVTLGSTLNEAGDRHPKIRQGALICAGATILGNIEVGQNAIVAANAVVLKPVPASCVVAGSPARQVGLTPSNLATFKTN
jgi:serine O-acetyltransferase